MSLEYLIQQIQYHEGPHGAYLRRYRKLAKATLASSAKDLRQLIDALLPIIADERNLRIALDRIERVGGPAAGPDGVRAADLADDEKWRLVRKLKDQINRDRYQTSAPRRCKVPKRIDSAERRCIWIFNLADRVVARGAAQILAPILDSFADSLSFSRPKRGPAWALAFLEGELMAGGRGIVIIEDMRDAFDCVPHAPMAEILAKHLPNPRVCELVKQLTFAPGNRGVFQGSALSAAMLNVYLDHVLHRRWRRNRGNPALLRYVDDILLVCRPGDDAKSVYDELARAFKTAGFAPKNGSQRAIRDLRYQDADWLGYRLRLNDKDLVITLKRFCSDDPATVRRGYEDMVERFARLHDRPEGWRSVPAVMDGLLVHAAPAFPFVDVEQICSQIQAAAAEAGYEDPRGLPAMLARWRNLHEKWLFKKNDLEIKLESARQRASDAAHLADGDDADAAAAAPF